MEDADGANEGIYFGVQIKGVNLSPEKQRKDNGILRFLRRRSPQISQMDGFFTTRYVLAHSEIEAVSMALSAIEAEIGQLSPDSRWKFEATEAWEESERLPEEGTGSGYTWYRS